MASIGEPLKEYEITPQEIPVEEPVPAGAPEKERELEPA